MQILLASLVALTSLVAGRVADSTSHPSPSQGPAPALVEATAPTPVATLVWVTSPWGFTDLYAVSHGWNTLVCSGTGLLFNFYYRGF